jgi:hypothetical protein
MSRLAGMMSQGQITTRGKYYDPNGLHVAEVLGLKFVDSSQSGASFAVVETEVRASNLHPKGDRRSWMVNLAHKSAGNNLKGFGVAIIGSLIAANPDPVAALKAFLEGAATVAESYKHPAAATNQEAAKFQAQVNAEPPFLRTLAADLKDADAIGGTILAFADMGTMDVFGDAFFDDSSPEDQPVGLVVNLETIGVKTRKDTPFTVHQWSAYHAGDESKIPAAE